MDEFRTRGFIPWSKVEMAWEYARVANCTDGQLR
jgi:hypothetical protein